MMKFANKPVYLAAGATDMRKSINGLAAMVEGSFDLDPTSNAMFVFCNRTRDRIKILEFDTDGYWLYFKRLEKGHFTWPKESDEQAIELTSEELEIMLGGSKVEMKLRRINVMNQYIA